MMRKLLSVALVTMVGSLLAGCGDDDDEGAASQKSKDGAAQEGAAASTAEPKSEYCRLAQKLRESFSPDRFSESDEAKVAKTFADFVGANSEDLDKLIAVAPDEIRPGVQLGVDAFRKAATGDLSALAALDGDEATAKAADYERQHCAPQPEPAKDAAEDE